MSKFYYELTKRNIYVHAHFYLACLMTLFVFWLAELAKVGTEQILFYLTLAMVTMIGFFSEYNQHVSEQVKARKELRQPVSLTRDSIEDMLFNYLGWITAYLIWF